MRWKIGPVFGLLMVTITSGIQAEMMVALTPNNQLLRFDSSSPGMTIVVGLVGLSSGEVMLGIDQRPVDAMLYGLSSANLVYSIDTMTGQVTPRGPAFTPPLATNLIGIDFNPTVDRIRYVDALSNNRRFNPATGASAAVDPNLTYASGGAPRAVGVAYTNSQLGGVPAGTVRELAIDSQLDALIEVGSQSGGNASFNAGVSSIIGNLNVDTTDDVGFDISGPTGIYYASLTTPNGSSLYTLNPTNGAATVVGAFPERVIDIAVLVPEPSALAILPLALAAVMANRARSRRRAG